MKLGWKGWVWAAFAWMTLNYGCGPGPVEIKAVYQRWTPMVVRDDRTADVVYEVKVQGSPGSVGLSLESTGGEIPLLDDGTGADKTAGDGIYTATVGAADVLFNFTADDVYRNFVGYLNIAAGGGSPLRYNVFADVITPAVPSVQIRGVSGTVQFSEHLVNIVDPAFYAGFSPQSLGLTFYPLFDDGYDFLNIIYEIGYFENRHFLGVRSDAAGIGIAAFNNTAAYGSAGRLLGCSVFPLPMFFDGASPDYQHEMGHQWINFLPVPPLNGTIPHWPLSDLASSLMGWGQGPNTQGLDFSFTLQPVGGDYVLIADANPKVFSDLDLYLMGLVPPSQVGPHFVFDNQSQTPSAGGTLAGPVTTIGVQDIIKTLGPRVPDHVQARKKFRVASIMVSRDGFLSNDAMRLYDYFSSRAEETQVVPYSSGLVKGQAKPFSPASQGLGRLDARINRHILIDASRDGGVWWYPQAGPFDPPANHQGKALADALRALGHRVVELPRPSTVTAGLLSAYDIVIRAVGFGPYSAAELAAYASYLQNGGRLLLLSDHGASDGLALSLGLKFEGATRGSNMLSNYIAHPITQSVGALYYNCGSGLTHYPASAQILGSLSATSYLDLNSNGAQDPGEPSGPPVLGVMSWGNGRIVFCGDTNLWETPPQPLLANVLKWFEDP